MLRTPGLGPKMDPKWEGPYTVENRLNKTTYELLMPDHPRRRMKRHVNLIKEYISPTVNCLLMETEDDFDPGKKERGGDGNLAINAGLTMKQRGVILELLRRHGDLTTDEPGMTKQSPLVIHTTTPYPIH